jgi:type II secretory pathway pseudopilin PulG
MEILVVIIIIAIMVGVTGTMFSGIVTFAERTDDHSVARRRADDAFNVLRVPILNAGLGIPSVSMDWYFDMGGLSAPVASWAGPVEVASAGGAASGDALRLIYSVKSGGRNGKKTIDDFSTKESTNVKQWISVPVEVTLASGVVPEVGGNGVWGGNGGVTSPVDMRAFVTFPGVFKSPLYAARYNAADAASYRIHLIGRTPHAVSEDSDVLWRNVIHPNHELYLVRAGIAYVDDESRFCFIDVTSGDYPLNALPKGKDINNGFTIDGIGGVKFEQADNKRIIKVTVLAEGDNVTTERAPGAGLVQLKSRWPGVTFDDGRYYEEFSMSWRTRNLGEE